MITIKKHLINAAALLSLIAVTSTMTSCDDDCDKYCYGQYTNIGTVTVKPVDGGNSFYMQLDDNTKIKAVNMNKAPYGDKRVRALIRFDFKDKDPLDADNIKPVFIYTIDSIRTKDLSPDMGTKNNEVYGNDAIDIINDWVTACEDNYLTLHVAAMWGNKQHAIYLVAENPEKPYELTLHHNAFNDNAYVMTSNMVAFSLDSLPYTGEEGTKITLKWKSTTGDKSITFNYKRTAGDVKD